jgi:hypothetical protein
LGGVLVRGRRWTLKEVFKAQQLKAMGYKRYEIARELNRTTKSVYEMFFALRRGTLHAKESA